MNDEKIGWRRSSLQGLAHALLTEAFLSLHSAKPSPLPALISTLHHFATALQLLGGGSWEGFARKSGRQLVG